MKTLELLYKTTELFLIIAKIVYKYKQKLTHTLIVNI